MGGGRRRRVRRRQSIAPWEAKRSKAARFLFVYSVYARNLQQHVFYPFLDLVTYESGVNFPTRRDLMR